VHRAYPKCSREERDIWSIAHRLTSRGTTDARRISRGTLMKCAHPGCKCTVPTNGAWGKYCSEHCQKAGDMAEPHCDCGHASCA